MLEPLLCVTVLAYCGHGADKVSCSEFPHPNPYPACPVIYELSCLEFYAFLLPIAPIHQKPINVLLQGVYLNKDNCRNLIAQLKTDLKQYENSLAKGELIPYMSL